MVHGHRLLIAGLVLVALAVALALLAPAGQDSLAADGIIYVDADATGGNDDGTSWDDAYIDLQDALADAVAGDQIWVAAGTYRPTWQSDSDPRSATFQMKNGVAIYGGFDPSVGDTAWEERDWVTNPTILSGNIGDEATSADNSYHVFYHPDGTALDGTAILDGFTITGGNADGGSDPHHFGGGMYNESSSPTLANCTFSGNSAGWHGGGMYDTWSSSPALTNCTFSGNSAVLGSGMFNTGGSSPTLTDCTFADNSATGSGGGMYNISASSPVLTNCTFSGNSALEGGGMINRTGSSPELTNVTFSGNIATANGGGMLNIWSASPTLTNCTFTGNSATGSGGGMYNYDSSPTLTNCTFSANSATDDGGGMVNTDSSPALTNCILWGDTSPEIVNDGSTPLITYSDIQGGCDNTPGNDCGDGNMDADPLFVDAAAGDLRLQHASPAIDAGDNDAPELDGITADLGGHPRFADALSVADTGNGDPPIVDMGAYEAPPDVIFVDLEAARDENGSSWDHAFTDLQAALTWAVDGVEIWVAAGTYKPSVEHGGTGDRYKSFQMVNGVAIYGGFDPSVGHDAWEERDWETNPTILSGDIGTEGDISDNVYHVLEGLWMTQVAVLDGFTITGGYANAPEYDHKFGGGLFAYAGELWLENLRFEGNTAAMWGGGLYMNVSNATLVNLTFSNNSADLGGGLCVNNSEAALTNCTFSGNSAGNGGGMYNYSSSPTLTNCTFSGNSATYYGGGMHNSSSSPTLTNCTFSGNSAGNGGGMHNSSSSPTLTNCILWGDSPDEIYGSPAGVTYSDIQGGYTGVGNINADPLFVDAASGDLRAQLTSPAIDAGDNDAPGLAGVTTDLGGHPRFVDVSSVNDTGNGDAPIVDMGAYEVPPDVILVDLEAAGANNGTSWEDAFTDLQRALAWAVDGVEIWVAEGTYAPTQEFSPGDPRTASFQMVNGVALYGGFDPSLGDTAFEDRDWEGNLTILSGDLNGDDGPGFDNNDENSYHVFNHWDGPELDGTAVLDGFTVTGGNANHPTDRPYQVGGGMNNVPSSPALTNCTFSNNSSVAEGGGIYNWSSSPALTNCTFSGNSAGYGGGMNNTLSSPALVNCLFSGNSAVAEGGGMNNYTNSSPALTNCRFDSNSAGTNGGGMGNVATSSPTLTNCTFANNSAVADGGGIYSSGSSAPALTNCTFWGNSANYGGGMSNAYDSSPTLTNCILWGDAPDEIYDFDSSPVVTYSDVQGSYPGAGNIAAHPGFVDPDNGDLHLHPCSPCIDAGDNDAPALPLQDFEGDARILDGDGNGTSTVDMGVDEVAVGQTCFRIYLPLVLRAY